MSNATEHAEAVNECLAEINEHIDLTLADPESVGDGDRLVRTSRASYTSVLLAQLAAWHRTDCEDAVGADLLERFARELAAHEATVV